MISASRLSLIASLVTSIEEARNFHGFRVGQAVRHRVTDETATVVEPSGPLEATRVPVVYDGDENETVYHTLARKLEVAS
jgi:hypothetical protein